MIGRTNTSIVRCDECVRGRVGKRRCRGCNGSGFVERHIDIDAEQVWLNTGAPSVSVPDE